MAAVDGSARRRQGAAPPAGAGTRRCVGCGARVSRQRAAAELVRLVITDEAADGVVVDLAGKSYGRGAWVHPRSDCLTAAARGGLTRAAGRSVPLSAQVLGRRIAAAAERRLAGLIGAAVRSGRAAVGTTAAEASVTRGVAALLLVACDASPPSGLLGRSAAAGLAIRWGTKDWLGVAAGRQQVAIIAVQDEGIAAVVRRAVALAETFGSAAGRAVEQVQ